MAIREPRAVSLLESIYRVDQPENEWVEGVRRAVEPSVEGAVLLEAHVYDASDAGRMQIRHVCGGSEEQRRWVEATSQRAQPHARLVHQIFGRRAGAPVISDVLGEQDKRLLLQEVFSSDWGIVDAWSLLGGDLRWRGLMVGAMMARPLGLLEPGLSSRWQAVAAHLSAAFCLRQAMGAGLAPTEGVLGPDGRLQHAEGPARSPDARESLRHAVRAIDRARTRHRRQSPEALAAWQAVVAGRWTLVDQTESDGKRVLLARVNELPVRAEAKLSRREAQVLGLAAQGWSNKQIAYRLGVGNPAVTNYLKRAAQKLGVTSRTDLVRRAQGVVGPERET